MNFEWRRLFAEPRFPRILGYPHHYIHAFHAFQQSPFDEAICVTVDGSGDQHCTVIWKCGHDGITPVQEHVMPDSLGWYYAAFTEYLGFAAYDGEYKVMGLAAYGESDAAIAECVARVLQVDAESGTYTVQPNYIHYGQHSYSTRHTDELAVVMGAEPRRPDEPITHWHENVAFAVQRRLEEAVLAILMPVVRKTGIHKVCLSGGVALNVKLNSRIFSHPEIEDVFAHPLCADCGAAAGAALFACYRETGSKPERLRSLALGYEEPEDTIERVLEQTGVLYERPPDICAAVAEELVQGRVVGWFQERMEAGPRALGQRSILVDPRRAENRDRVNAVVKFREYWRPFCPSIRTEAMARYFDRYTEALFMIIAFDANDRLRREAPAIVHVDGTSRVQAVREADHPLYYKLLTAFEARTGVPVVLNTSFNVKGEPIVRTITDALRTFWSTGIEVLAAGGFIVRKPGLDNRGG